MEVSPDYVGRSTGHYSGRLTAQGKDVRYIRSTFVPGEARCMCLFEAPTEQNVRELNDRAKIPYTRVVEALDLTP